MYCLVQIIHKFHISPLLSQVVAVDMIIDDDPPPPYPGLPGQQNFNGPPPPANAYGWNPQLAGPPPGSAVPMQPAQPSAPTVGVAQVIMDPGRASSIKSKQTLCTALGVVFTIALVLYLLRAIF